jgi:hypothetical protein
MAMPLAASVVKVWWAPWLLRCMYEARFYPRVMFHPENGFAFWFGRARGRRFCVSFFFVMMLIWFETLVIEH